MASYNGDLSSSRAPPNKRPRLSYEGFTSRQEPVYSRSPLSSDTRGRNDVKSSAEPEASSVWNFSRNLFGTLCETSKLAVGKIKAAGSFLMGFGGPWKADELNGSYADEEYSQTAIPGQKRKLMKFNERVVASQISVSPPMSPPMFPKLPETPVSFHSARKSIFQTPWTNPTQQEAIRMAAIVKAQSPRQRPRPVFSNSTLLSELVCDETMDLSGSRDMLEESFSEELEPEGEAVLSASPERLAAAENSLPPPAQLTSTFDALFSSDQSSIALCYDSDVSVSKNTSPKWSETPLEMGAKKDLPNGDDSEGALDGSEFGAGELVTGHIEMAKGVMDVGGGHSSDLFDFMDQENAVRPVMENTIKEKAHSDRDMVIEIDGDETFDSEEDEEDDGESEEEDEENEVDDEDVVVLSSDSEEEEEDTSDRSYGLVADLTEGPMEVRLIQEPTESAAGSTSQVEGPGSFNDFVRQIDPAYHDPFNQVSSSTNGLPMGESDDVIDFDHVDTSHRLDDVVSSDQLEKEIIGANSGDSDQAEGDDLEGEEDEEAEEPADLAAALQEEWEAEADSDAEAEKEENGAAVAGEEDSDDDSDIICDGVFSPQYEEGDEEEGDFEEEESDAEERDGDDDKEDESDSEEDSNLDEPADSR